MLFYHEDIAKEAMDLTAEETKALSRIFALERDKARAESIQMYLLGVQPYLQASADIGENMSGYIAGWFSDKKIVRLFYGETDAVCF